MNNFSKSARRRIVRADLYALMSTLDEFKCVPIILLYSTVMEVCGPPLREAGHCVLNDSSSRRASVGSRRGETDRLALERSAVSVALSTPVTLVHGVGRPPDRPEEASSRPGSFCAIHFLAA